MSFLLLFGIRFLSQPGGWIAGIVYLAMLYWRSN